MIGTKKNGTKRLSADESLSHALEWAIERLEDRHVAPQASGSDWANISIAISLREIAAKLK